MVDRDAADRLDACRVHGHTRDGEPDRDRVQHAGTVMAPDLAQRVPGRRVVVVLDLEVGHGVRGRWFAKAPADLGVEITRRTDRGAERRRGSHGVRLHDRAVGPQDGRRVDDVDLAGGERAGDRSEQSGAVLHGDLDETGELVDGLGVHANRAAARSGIEQRRLAHHDLGRVGEEIRARCGADPIRYRASTARAAKPRCAATRRATRRGDR